mgnify:CR=1 FL=1
MTRFKVTKILLGLSVAILALSACGPRVSTPSPDQMKTYVAETIAAQLTRTEIARPSETPTPTFAPSPTLALPTATVSVPTAALGLPTSTVAGPATATPPPAQTGVDAGVWTSSNPADGSTIDSGEEFQVVVTFMNTGQTTWTTSYYIMHTGGALMGAPDKINMPYAVPPSMTVTITIDFIAPTEIGTVKSDWMIVNSNDVAFSSFWFEYITD